MKGLLVSILRDASVSDCTNDGVTSPARATRGMAVLLGVPDGNWSEDSLPEGVPVLVAEKRSYRASTTRDCTSRWMTGAAETEAAREASFARIETPSTQ